MFARVLSWPRPHAFCLSGTRSGCSCVGPSRCVCVCSHLPAPLPLIRADYTPQLVSQQLITPRQDQSSHLLKISCTWQQKATAECMRSLSLRSKEGEIFGKVTLTSLFSLASDIFYICYPCLLFMLEYVFMEGGLYACVSSAPRRAR